MRLEVEERQRGRSNKQTSLDVESARPGSEKKLTASNDTRLPDAVPIHGQGDVAKAVEDADEREPDLERVDVVLAQVGRTLQEADDEVVRERQQPGGPDGVVRADVGDDGELGRYPHVGREEAAEKRRERPAEEPVPDRVEEELVAAVRVLLPSGELVVDGQRHALLEAFAGVGAEPDAVPDALQAQGHVKVLRHVRLRPELLVAVLVRVDDLLQCGPAKYGVVADEGDDVPVGAGVLDRAVDQVREETTGLLSLLRVRSRQGAADRPT